MLDLVERPATKPLTLTPDELALIEDIRRVKALSNNCTRFVVVRIEHDRLGVMACEGIRWHSRTR